MFGLVRVVVLCAVCFVCLGSVARAASAVECVPSAAGAAVTSGGLAPGSCGAGATKVALPAGAADQQTLISILPHLRFTAAGPGGKPTVVFSGVNVQVVSGSGSTSGTLNGTGNVIIGYDENPSARADRLARSGLGDRQRVHVLFAAGWWGGQHRGGGVRGGVGGEQSCQWHLFARRR